MEVKRRDKEISVVLVNYKSANLINAMELKLAALLVECVVVDNSGDFFPADSRTKVIEVGSNIGFGRACNLGVAHCTGDVIIFINPDLELEAKDFARFLEFSGQQDGASIWGPFIYDSKGAVVSLFQPGRAGLAFRRRALTEAERSSGRVETLFVSGACLAIHRDLFKRIGGFSDKIFLYAEDLDLGFRARELGAVVFMTSTVNVRHRGGASSTGVDRFKRLFRSFKGHYTFFRMHGYLIPFAALNALHLATGARW